MENKRTFRSLNSLTTRDTSQLLFSVGIRNAIGVIIPLIIALFTHHLLSGIAISVGALVAGFASLGGTARKRTRTMLLAATWMGVATLIGALSGAIFWLTILLIMASGFIAGMMVAIGAEAGQVGLLSTNAFILISSHSLNLSHSLYQAGFVISGGLLQTALMILTDVLNRQSTESMAVSEVYLAISKYTIERTRNADLQVATAMLKAETALSDSFMNRLQSSKLRTLMAGAEQIRIHIVAISRIAKHEDAQDDKEHSDEIKVMLMSFAKVLTQIAQTVKVSNSLRGSILEYNLSIVHRHLTHLRRDSNQTPLQMVRYSQEIYLELIKLQQVLNADPSTQVSTLKVQRAPMLTPLGKTYATLRANFTFQSTIFRHAIRVSLTLGVASNLAHILSLPHGYWLPLTTLIILKPDFSATFSRGIARMLGTLLGILIATLLIEMTGRNHSVGIILVTIFACAMYTVVNFNYALYSCAVTSEIIILLSFFQNTAPFSAMTARLIGTLLGSGLALLAYILWPTWQRRSIHLIISDLIYAQRRYFQAILSSHHQDETQHAQIHRQSARLARANAVAAVNQAMNEPGSKLWDKNATLGILTTLHRFSDMLLSLEAHFMDADNLQFNGTISTSAKYIDDALKVIGFVVRHPEIEMNEESIKRMIAHPETNLIYQSLNFTEMTFANLENIIQSMLRIIPLTQPD